MSKYKRNKVKSDIGPKLKQHRLKLGLTSQQECGIYIGIRPATYGEIESGYNTQLSTLLHVLDKLNLKLEIVEK